MRRWTASIALGAVLCTSGSALARTNFEFAGAAAGEVVKFDFANLWYHHHVGLISFEGGTLDYARLDSEGTFLYIIDSKPREHVWLDITATCTAPSELPCAQFSSLSASSLRFTTPGLPYRDADEIDFPGGEPPGPGRFESTYSTVFSTLSLAFIPDEEGGVVTYRVAGQHSVPEPATWALLIAGFSLVGAALRRRQSAAA